MLTVVMTVLSLGFGSMDINAMVWRTVWCLVWEAVLSLLATLAINGLAMMAASTLVFGVLKLAG